MNSKTYLRLIAFKYGGLMRFELEERLIRLVELAKKEQLPISVQKETLNPIENTDIKGIEVIEKKIDYNLNSGASQSNYDKAMNFIRSMNNEGWKHISEVPLELFRNFWNIAELHKEIELDQDRDWQYFRVQGFRKLNAMAYKTLKDKVA